MPRDIFTICRRLGTAQDICGECTARGGLRNSNAGSCLKATHRAEETQIEIVCTGSPVLEELHALLGRKVERFDDESYCTMPYNLNN